LFFLGNSFPMLSLAQHFGSLLRLISTGMMLCEPLKVHRAMAGGKKVGNFSEAIPLVPVETGNISQVAATT
jgi:hypothetical protein